MGTPVVSEEVRAYFAGLLKQVQDTYAIARAARTRGFDPELDVEIPLTVDLAYAGPIRSAGGTGQALSVLIADIVRRELGLGRYIPTREEVERFKEEIPLYRQAQHLQYTPSDEEISLIVSNCPVAIDGEGTEDAEISGHRDLPRIETNRIRGGACLVIADGMCLKAPKIQKHVKKLRIDGWEFIDEYLARKESRPEDTKDELGVEPSDVFIQNIVAGRPVLCHPSRPGGLRLRYGRTRATGLAALALHPATMHILDDFIAVGTQIKTERPGKAGAVTPCDRIEGPLVVLDSGDFVEVTDAEAAKRLTPRVRVIADLGEILVPFGEFLENNHVLMPGAFSLEWYGALLREKLARLPESWETVDAPQAIAWSREFVLPLHPRYNLFFHDLTVEELKRLRELTAAHGRIADGRLILPGDEEPRELLMRLGVPYHVADKEIVVERHTEILLATLGIESEVGLRICSSCGKRWFLPKCSCGGHTLSRSGPARQHIPLAEVLRTALDRVGEPKPPDIKAVQGMISKTKTPEPLEKGILRAKHDIYVFKDGTTRFDMTNLPLTHFTPREASISVEAARRLGYTKDRTGQPLERADQILELRPQDIVVARSGGEYLVRVAAFLDDLLERLYGLERFYDAKASEDLLGHLVLTLAPHTSCGVLARIVGFTDANACFAHPYLIAARRRNCDGDEDSVILLLDSLINFSRAFLPDKRGGLMDAPLVLTTRIDPNEIDKEAHNIDLLTAYPLALYDAAERFAHPKEIEPLIDTVSKRIGSVLQYEGFSYTHETSDVAQGPLASAYGEGSMAEKIDKQLELALRIRAVDPNDVVARIVVHHFLPDLIGNLKAFSSQQVRCTKCGEKDAEPKGAEDHENKVRNRQVREVRGQHSRPQREPVGAIDVPAEQEKADDHEREAGLRRGGRAECVPADRAHPHDVIR